MPNANKINASNIDFSSTPGWSLSNFLRGDGTFATPGAGGISGSGIINYYGKWTSSSNIGTGGLRSDVSGNLLGLNTNPIRDFDILSSSSSIEVALSNSISGFGLTDGASILLSGNNFSITNKEIGDFSIGTASLNSITIKSSGLIGINNISPQTPFDLYYSNPSNGIISQINNNAPSSLTGAQLQFVQNTIESWVIGQPAGQSRFSWWYGRYIGTPGVEAMSLKNDGNLGIGTTNPLDKLTIRGTGVKMRIENTSSTQFGEIVFFEDTVNKAGIWVNGSSQGSYSGSNSLNINQQSNAPIGFFTNSGIERMRIEGGGNIYVGGVFSAAGRFNVQTDSTIVAAFTSNSASGSLVRITSNNPTSSATLDFSDGPSSFTFSKFQTYFNSSPGGPRLEIHGPGTFIDLMPLSGTSTLRVSSNNVHINRNTASTGYFCIDEPSGNRVFDSDIGGIRTREPGLSTFTSHAWKFGKLKSVVTPVLLPNYLEVEVNGVVYAIALLNLS